jgi:hypothetical protein
MSTLISSSPDGIAWKSVLNIIYKKTNIHIALPGKIYKNFMKKFKKQHFETDGSKIFTDPLSNWGETVVKELLYPFGTTQFEFKLQTT